MSPTVGGDAALLIVCVVLSALASATETALTSVGRIRIRHLAEEGSRSARVLHHLQQDPNRFLSTVLVVNTVALIVASVSATLLSLHFLPAAWGFGGTLAASLVLSVFLLIFAEVTPKSLAIRHAESVALLAAGPVDTLAEVFRPVLWVTTALARAVTGGRAAHAPYLTEEELMTLLHVSEEQGVIEEEEREMIHGIIEIGDKAVREVMVPRTDITAVDRSLQRDEVVAVFRRHHLTRLPIMDGDLDHIVGLIHVKDLLELLAEPERPFDLARLTRPIQHVPEQKKVDELLHQMQMEKVHMMVVVDEYGGTSGLVTLEDLLEEIVGEIRDEYDAAEQDLLQITGTTSAVVDARHPMAELDEILDLGVEESEDYDSVGGYVLATLGEVPSAGTTFRTGEVDWTVEEVQDRRVRSVRLEAQKPWPSTVLIEFGFEAPPPGGASEGGYS